MSDTGIHLRLGTIVVRRWKVVDQFWPADHLSVFRLTEVSCDVGSSTCLGVGLGVNFGMRSGMGLGLGLGIDLSKIAWNQDLSRGGL